MESIKGQQLSVSAATGVQLTDGEMQSIRGKVIWKVIVAQAGWGALSGLVVYVGSGLATGRRLTWQGAAKHMALGAAAGLGGEVAVKVVGKVGSKVGRWIKHRRSGQTRLDRWMRLRR